MNNRPIDSVIEALINGESDRAIGMLMRLQQNGLEGEAAEYGGAIADLPPIKPVKQTKRKPPTKPFKARCGTCGAKPGENCWYMTSAGKHGKIDTEKGQRADGSYHAKRGIYE